MTAHSAADLRGYHAPGRHGRPEEIMAQGGITCNGAKFGFQIAFLHNHGLAEVLLVPMRISDRIRGSNWRANRRGKYDVAVQKEITAVLGDDAVRDTFRADA